MADLTESLEIYTEKAIKLIKTVDRIVNGADKELVLEVGNHTTKLVEYKLQKETIEVQKGTILNTPLNVIENGRIINHDRLVSILKQALIQERIKTKDFIVSIISKEIIIRQMECPQMRENELKTFVQLNSRDIFPVNLANYVLGYNIIEKGEKNRIMIVAIPKEIVTSYIELGNKLGLKLKGFNYSGYELYNFLNYEIAKTEQAYMAIDLGARNTNVIIIANGALKFNKILPKGSEESSKYISEELNCSITRAEQLKRQYNTVIVSEESDENSEENIVAKYTCRCIDNIMQDISRIVEFFNANNFVNKISKIYIVGNAGKIKGVEEYITKRLNIETKSFKNLSKVTYGKDGLKLKTRQLSFINCFGAHNLEDRKFYFIKDDLKLRKQSVFLKLKFNKFALAAVLMALLLLTYNSVSLNLLEKEYEELSQFVTENSKLIALRNDLTIRNNEITSEQQSLDNLGIGIEGNVESIKKIGELVDELKTDASVRITRYAFNKKELTITFNTELPLGITEFSPEYHTYTSLAYDLLDSIQENLGLNVEVIGNPLALQFTLRVTLK